MKVRDQVKDSNSGIYLHALAARKVALKERDGNACRFWEALLTLLAPVLLKGTCPSAKCSKNPLEH